MFCEYHELFKSRRNVDQGDFLYESRSSKYLVSIFTIYDAVVAKKVCDDRSGMERIRSDINTLLLLNKMLYHES